MESIVSVAIIIDSIVSVHRNYEKRKEQKTGGKWHGHSCGYGFYPKDKVDSLSFCIALLFCTFCFGDRSARSGKKCFRCRLARAYARG
jgi:hypothetical protein